jgi:hypothetical protein
MATHLDHGMTDVSYLFPYSILAIMTCVISGESRMQPASVKFSSTSVAKNYCDKCGVINHRCGFHYVILQPTQDEPVYEYPENNVYYLFIAHLRQRILETDGEDRVELIHHQIPDRLYHFCKFTIPTNRHAIAMIKAMESFENSRGVFTTNKKADGTPGKILESIFEVLQALIVRSSVACRTDDKFYPPPFPCCTIAVIPCKNAGLLNEARKAYKGLHTTGNLYILLIGPAEFERSEARYVEGRPGTNAMILAGKGYIEPCTGRTVGLLRNRRQ